MERSEVVGVLGVWFFEDPDQQIDGSPKNHIQHVWAAVGGVPCLRQETRHESRSKMVYFIGLSVDTRATTARAKYQRGQSFPGWLGPRSGWHPAPAAEVSGLQAVSVPGEGGSRLPDAGSAVPKQRVDVGYRLVSTAYTPQHVRFLENFASDPVLLRQSGAFGACPSLPGREGGRSPLGLIGLPPCLPGG